MNTVKSSDHPAVRSSTRCGDLYAGCSTEMNSPGPHAHLAGRENSRPGDASAAGLLLICLFAAALLIPFERLIPQERNGNKSSPSTSTGSPQKRKLGGTERGQYEEQ